MRILTRIENDQRHWQEGGDEWTQVRYEVQREGDEAEHVGHLYSQEPQHHSDHRPHQHANLLKGKPRHKHGRQERSFTVGQGESTGRIVK